MKDINGKLVRMAMLDKEPNIKKFKELGFLLDDDNQVVTSRLASGSDKNNSCPQLDAPETETETETEENNNSRKISTPTKEIINLYHEIIPEMPRIKVLTAKRKAGIERLFKYNQAHQDLKWWKDYFNHVRNSDFLMGRKQQINGHENWKCDLEFLVNLDKFAKIIEGKYHGA